MENIEINAEAGMEIIEPLAIKYYGWKIMPHVIGNETFEKLGAIVMSSNMLVYLTTVFHMMSIHAATILHVFNRTTNLATILGAFISDAYLGRYKTLGCAFIVTLLERRELKEKARPGQETVLPGDMGGKNLEPQEHLAEGGSIISISASALLSIFSIASGFSFQSASYEHYEKFKCLSLIVYALIRMGELLRMREEKKKNNTGKKFLLLLITGKLKKKIKKGRSIWLLSERDGEGRDLHISESQFSPKSEQRKNVEGAELLCLNPYGHSDLSELDFRCMLSTWHW